MLAQEFERAPDHVGIEGTAESAFTAHRQQQNALFLVPPQQDMSAFRHASRDGMNQSRDRTRVGPRRKSSLLRAPQPRSRHEFHGASDLLGIFHRADAPFDIELRGHGRLSSGDHGYLAAAAPAANRSLNSERSFFRPSRISSSIAFFVAILLSRAPE